METKDCLDKLNEANAKFCNPSEHLAVDEVIVKFKGKVISRHYIPKKRKLLASKFTNSVTNQGIRVTWVCTWVETHTPPLTTWLQHASVRHLTRRVESLGHKIFMDNFFSSPRLVGDLDRCKINSCRTVWPHDFGSKQLKLKRGDIRVRIRGGFTALVWKDRQEVYSTCWLTWTHHQQKESFVMTAPAGTVQPAHWLHRQFWSYG